MKEEQVEKEFLKFVENLIKKAGEKMKKYKFTAKEVILEGKEGYMVNQIRDGGIVGYSFVPADEYETYCSQIGVQPEIID